MSKNERREVVVSALSIAEAVTEGHMQPADLEAAAVEQCHELFSVVYGPEDPVWPVQVDVARQVLAFGGLPATELAEWVAVQRRREGKPATEPEQSWIERALADGVDEGDDEPIGDDVRVDAVRDAMAVVERRLGIVPDPTE